MWRRAPVMEVLPMVELEPKRRWDMDRSADGEAGTDGKDEEAALEAAADDVLPDDERSTRRSLSAVTGSRKRSILPEARSPLFLRAAMMDFEAFSFVPRSTSGQIKMKDSPGGASVDVGISEASKRRRKKRRVEPLGSELTL